MANVDPHMPGAPVPQRENTAHASAGAAVADVAPSFHSLPPMRYPNLYTWFVLVSSLDIMLTWMVLEHQGGYEVNPIAAAVIEHWGLPGAIGFKFSLMLFVIIVCEIVGRQRDRTALQLARWSVGVSAFPPVYTTILVALHLTDSPLLALVGM